MRRKDREVTEAADLAEIIARCRVCRIAYADEAGLAIVPLNFGFAYENGRLTLYVHSAREGRKVRAWAKGAQVAFEMDTDFALVAGETACAYGCLYASIVGEGRIAPVTDPQEKIKGLEALMRQQTGREFALTADMAESVNVYRLEAEHVSGKQHMEK